MCFIQLWTQKLGALFQVMDVFENLNKAVISFHTQKIRVPNILHTIS